MLITRYCDLGIFQEGYALGYLLAAVVNLTLVNPRDDWRLMWVKHFHRRCVN